MSYIPLDFDRRLDVAARAPLAHAYCARLVNVRKREYAYAYAGWKLNGSKGDAPDRPAGLSLMAAQAVQRTLNELGLGA